MSLPFIFVVATAALAAFLLKWRRSGLSLLALSLLTAAAAGLPPLPAALLAGLQVHDESRDPEWKSRNAIIVLGAGTVPGGTPAKPLDGTPSKPTVELTLNGRTRVLRAAHLYFACLQGAKRDCHLFLSGGDPLKNGATEAAVMARELGKLGVRAADITLEAESRNTFQNARNTAPLVRAKGYELAVLTTSGTHMRRAMLFFSFFLVDATPAPADRVTPYRAAMPVSFNLAATDMAMHEYLGIFQFHFYNYMGWNEKPGA